MRLKRKQNLFLIFELCVMSGNLMHSAVQKSGISRKKINRIFTDNQVLSLTPTNLIYVFLFLLLIKK